MDTPDPEIPYRDEGISGAKADGSLDKREKASSSSNSERRSGTLSPPASANVRAAGSSVKPSNERGTGSAMPIPPVTPLCTCECGARFLPQNYNRDIRSLQASVTITRPEHRSPAYFGNGLRGFADSQAAG
jgi:hypothetical protein